MRPHHRAAGVALLAACLGWAPLAHAQERTPEQRQAEFDAFASAVDAWFGMLDKGDHAGIWESASRRHRTKLGKCKGPESAKAEAAGDWSEPLKQMMAETGAKVSRKMNGAGPALPPNWPAGSYRIVQLDTRFEKKEKVREAVWFSRDDDGQWRAVSYHLCYR